MGSIRLLTYQDCWAWIIAEVKVSILGPERAFKDLGVDESNAVPRSTSVPADAGLNSTDSLSMPFDPAHDEQFINSQRRLQALRELTDLFKGKIVDVSAESAVIEMNAKSDRIDAFLKLVRPFGILEAVRSGLMAMPRSAKMSFYEEEVDVEAEEKTEIDLSSLPPS